MELGWSWMWGAGPGRDDDGIEWCRTRVGANWLFSNFRARFSFIAPLAFFGWVCPSVWPGVRSLNWKCLAWFDGASGTVAGEMRERIEESWGSKKEMFNGSFNSIRDVWWNYYHQHWYDTLPSLFSCDEFIHHWPSIRQMYRFMHIYPKVQAYLFHNNYCEAFNA